MSSLGSRRRRPARRCRRSTPARTQSGRSHLAPDPRPAVGGHRARPSWRSCSRSRIFATCSPPYDPRQSVIGHRDRAQGAVPRAAPCIHLPRLPRRPPEHCMGLDGNVIDEFARVVFGARVSLRDRLRDGRRRDRHRHGDRRRRRLRRRLGRQRPDAHHGRSCWHSRRCSWPSSIVTDARARPGQRDAGRRHRRHPNLRARHARLRALGARAGLRDSLASARRIRRSASCAGASCPTR